VHVELDHFFVLVSRGAPEADLLRAFGLTEGSANTHQGQGTANRRFFFHNAFLELVWVEDEAEAASDLAARTRLGERWQRRGQGASPFGIGFRPGRSPDSMQAPFDTWDYRPPYLPPELSIQMATSSQRVSEPLLFFLAFAKRGAEQRPRTPQPLDHAAGLRLITRLRVTGPPHELATSELRAAELACPWLSIAPGGDEVAEVGFDGEAAGKSHDFRPALPLVFHW
jgi:hypothetical protein